LIDGKSNSFFKPKESGSCNNHQDCACKQNQHGRFEKARGQRIQSNIVQQELSKLNCNINELRELTNRLIHTLEEIKYASSIKKTL
jgi:hypothetical protein